MVVYEISNSKIILWNCNANRTEIGFKVKLTLPVFGYYLVQGKVVIFTFKLNIRFTEETSIPTPIKVQLVFPFVLVSSLS